MKKLLIILFIAGAILLAGCTQQNGIGQAIVLNPQCKWESKWFPVNGSAKEGYNIAEGIVTCSKGIAMAGGAECQIESSTAFSPPVVKLSKPNWDPAKQAYTGWFVQCAGKDPKTAGFAFVNCCR